MPCECKKTLSKEIFYYESRFESQTYFVNMISGDFVGKDIDESIAEIDRKKACGTYLLNRDNGENVIVGMDNRLTSEELKYHLVKGLLSTGCLVTDIGLCNFSDALSTSVQRGCLRWYNGFSKSQS